MGKIGKLVFKHFAESECPRQMFLDMAEGNPQWISPYRDLVEDEQRRVSGKTLADLGHAYEQTVYKVLQRNKATRAAESDSGDSVVQTTLNAAALAAYGDELIASDPTAETLVLIEHSWETPASFVRFLLDLPGDATLPFRDPPGELRPDLWCFVVRAQRTVLPRPSR